MRLDKLVNAEAERAVLATILFHPASMDVFHELGERDIASSEMRMIFCAMAQEVAEGRRPTPFTVAPYLPDEAFIERTPVQFVAGLSRFSDPAALKDSLQAVRDLAARRALVETAEIINGEAWNAGFPPIDLANQAMQHLDGIASGVRRTFSKSAMFAQAAGELLVDLDSGDRSDFIDTGLDTLNRVLGGWPRGELAILAGRPSMGKSAVLFSVARQAAARGVNVLIFSLEMRMSAVMARMLSDMAYSANPRDCVPYDSILRREVDGHQRRRLGSLLESVGSYPIRIDDTPGLTATEIQMRARKFAAELDKDGRRLDLVLVDHLGKVRASDRYSGNMVHETGEKSNAFMCMGKELNVAMLVAHQLNRGPEGREEKRAGMADLRDSGNLEQDAHTILFPFRESYYLERQKYDDEAKEKVRRAALRQVRNQMEINVAKNRNGPCCVVELSVDMGSNAIRDKLEERHAAVESQRNGGMVPQEEGSGAADHAG
jgi:replicative DNA helicase